MNEIWKPSVTVAAIVSDSGRYLLVEEETSDGLRLNQPAGHLDPGESLVDAAIREALEETARPFTPQGLLGVYLNRSRSTRSGREVTYLRFAFAGSVGQAVPGRALDTGIVRTLWLTPDEIRASVERHRSPLVVRCMEDHLLGRPLAPLDVFYTDISALYAPDPDHTLAQEQP